MFGNLFGGRDSKDDAKSSEPKVLIVGGGFAGMSSAISLKSSGFDVQLIDLDTEWRAYGAGVTITGATLRAYKHLGMVDEIAQKGAISNGSKIFHFGGNFMRMLEEAPLEDGLPATGGIMRPLMHNIMSTRVIDMDIPVELGVTIDALNQNSEGVEVTFSNGEKRAYDLVVGADGVASKVRDLAFPECEAAKPTGQGCWRISMNRRPGMETGEFYFGHEFPVGITLCGPDQMYMWMLTPDDGSVWVEEAEGLEMLRERIRPFGGTVAWIRENMSTEHWVNYRPLSAIIQPKASWRNGRIVLVGDSAHATTPHLASGAGIAVEGGIVLGEELGRPGVSIDEGLDAYVERRFERCRDVVESSVRIGQMQLQGAGPQEVGAAIGAASHRLIQPY